MKKSPCYKCPDRHAGCHSECERYKEYHEKNKKRLELKKEEFNRENPEKDYKLTMYQKHLKNDGGKKK